MRINNQMIIDLIEIQKKGLQVADVAERRRAQLIARGLIRVRYGSIEVTSVGEMLISAYTLGVRVGKVAA